MISSMNLYDDCIHDGFTETQARRLVILHEGQEESFAKDVIEVKQDVINLMRDTSDIKTGLARLEGKIDGMVKGLDANLSLMRWMIGGMGAATAVGFGLIVYFVKG